MRYRHFGRQGFDELFLRKWQRGRKSLVLFWVRHLDSLRGLSCGCSHRLYRNVGRRNRHHGNWHRRHRHPHRHPAQRIVGLPVRAQRLLQVPRLAHLQLRQKFHPLPLDLVLNPSLHISIFSRQRSLDLGVAVVRSAGLVGCRGGSDGTVLGAGGVVLRAGVGDKGGGRGGDVAGPAGVRLGPVGRAEMDRHGSCSCRCTRTCSC
mmetsp:Transcript_3621/g.10293  ORF Transcript_3621/g.10293 Transcript_3621/m.10293 type:complete len:205 (-) Transcript_3621:506-1120(-)